MFEIYLIGACFGFMSTVILLGITLFIILNIKIKMEKININISDIDYYFDYKNNSVINKSNNKSHHLIVYEEIYYPLGIFYFFIFTLLSWIGVIVSIYMSYFAVDNYFFNNPLRTSLNSLLNPNLDKFDKKRILEREVLKLEE